MTQTSDNDRSLLQGVDQPGGGGESGPDRDRAGAHGRDVGEHGASGGQGTGHSSSQESGPDRDKAGAHGRDVGEHGASGGQGAGQPSGEEAGSDRDKGGMHGRDVGEH